MVVVVGEWGEAGNCRDGKQNASIAIRRRPQWWDGTELVPESICSRECGSGEVKKTTGSSCCWTCVACQPSEFLASDTECEPCPLGQWPDPNTNRSSCYQLEVLYQFGFRKSSHPSRLPESTKRPEHQNLVLERSCRCSGRFVDNSLQLGSRFEGDS